MPTIGDTEKVEIILQVVILLLSFVFGRYSTYRSDCRAGMKEINAQFYQPFITQYENTKHACAMWFVDLPMDVQSDMMKLLFEYRACCSPKLQQKILELDQPFSYYSTKLNEDVPVSEQMSLEDVKYIEKVFGEVYTLIDKQYKRNTRILYCSWFTRLRYRITDLWYWLGNKGFSKKVGVIMKNRIPRVIATCILLNTVYLLLDIFNVPSRMGIDIPSVNWDSAALVVGNIIVIGLFMVTYFLLDKRNVEKENNQREIAKRMLLTMYDSCVEMAELFEDEDNRAQAIKHCDFNKLEFEDAVMSTYLNLPFEHHDAVLDFATAGVISAEEFEDYMKIQKQYKAHVNLRIILFDEDVLPNFKKEDLLALISTAKEKLGEDKDA